MRMKRLFVVVFVLAVFQLQDTQSQTNIPMQYGFNLSAVNSGSGHGSNLVLNFVATDNKKAMEFGAIVRPGDFTPKGAEFKYKIFPGKYDYYVNNMMVRPFVMYNCLYQNETTTEPLVIETTSGPLVFPDNKAGTISTMEHYLGTGLFFRFLNNFYFSSSAGIGVYLGSISKLETPETLGIHKRNGGLTGNMKLSFGMFFL
jgi:hypothetical protein